MRVKDLPEKLSTFFFFLFSRTNHKTSFMVHFGAFLYFECQTAPGYHSLSLNRKEQHEHSAKK